MFAKMTAAGTQTGCFSARGLGGYVLDVLEKCNDIQNLLSRCHGNIQNNHTRLNQSERKLDAMQTTIGCLSDKVDSLGVHMLQDNSTMAQRNLAVDKLKREIASKQERLERINQEREDHEMRSHESSLQTLRDERASLERHLQKINRDIDTVYEDIFDKEQKLLGTRQLLTDKHIQSQLQEREFLRQTAYAIVQKVFDLERKVRKERGDNGWESQQISEPNWAHTLDAPSFWLPSPTLTREQLKHMIEEYKRKYRFAYDAEDSTGCSGFASEEIVMINLLDGARSFGHASDSESR